jgi:hypothetical protein
MKNKEWVEATRPLPILYSSFIAQSPAGFLCFVSQLVEHLYQSISLVALDF